MNHKQKASPLRSSESNSKVLFPLLYSPIELSQNDDIGVSVGLEDDNNLYVWNIVFEGPADTLYEVRLLASASLTHSFSREASSKLS